MNVYYHDSFRMSTMFLKFLFFSKSDQEDNKKRLFRKIRNRRRSLPYQSQTDMLRSENSTWLSSANSISALSFTPYSLTVKAVVS